MSQNNAGKSRAIRRRGIGGETSKNPLKTLKRLLSYIFKQYKFLLFVVLIAIIISSLANVIGTLFIKNLIDDYIMPLLHKSNPNFMPLFKAIVEIAVVYGIGVLSTYAYSRLMIKVSQGSLKRLRDDMFSHMEMLPISFFDTHSHGNLMSLYTNDTDTLRQMISQSIPQLLSSIITVVSVFISMLFLSLPLAFVEILIVVVIAKITKDIGKKSGKYFNLQQKDMGTVDGYIEEMMNGQKVV